MLNRSPATICRSIRIKEIAMSETAIVVSKQHDPIAVSRNAEGTLVASRINILPNVISLLPHSVLRLRHHDVLIVIVVSMFFIVSSKIELRTIGKDDRAVIVLHRID